MKQKIIDFAKNFVAKHVVNFGIGASIVLAAVLVGVLGLHTESPIILRIGMLLITGIKFVLPFIGIYALGQYIREGFKRD